MKNKVENLYESCGCLLGTLILIATVVLALAIVFGTFCLEGWVFMLLWNSVVVELFSAPPILSYWLCVGIVIFITFIGKLFTGWNIPAKLD